MVAGWPYSAIAATTEIAAQRANRLAATQRAALSWLAARSAAAAAAWLVAVRLFFILIKCATRPPVPPGRRVSHRTELKMPHRRLKPLVASGVRIVRKLVPPGVLALNQALALAFRMNALEP
jgi:hypothetical protein